MHVQTGCSGNDSDIVIPSLPCSDSQPADSPRFLMDGLGTNTEFGSNGLELTSNSVIHCPSFAKLK